MEVKVAYLISYPKETTNPMNKTLSFFLFITVLCIYGQNRPQEPKEPFDYHVEEVVFKNETDSVALAGTFTYPKTGSDFASVILISGSGAQNRDSELMNHKPFLVIADYLTKNGIAVLRVDDRGAGKSEGSHNDTGLEGLARDTQSAIAYLKSRKEIGTDKIGLVGHSLGGVIAPMVASQSNDVSFVVLLSGSALRGDQLMLLQKEKIERKMLVPEPMITLGQQNMKGAYDIILASSDRTQLETDLKGYFTKVFGAALPENQLNLLSEQLAIPWLVDFIKFDPAIALSKTKCPVLALNGSNDLQVPATENLESIEKNLKEGGNVDVETMALDNLNHLFQESETGLPNEYASIEQTFSPKAMEIMLKWIQKKTK